MIRSPCDSIVITVIAGATPHTSVLPVKIDSCNRAVWTLVRLHLVTHTTQFAAHPLRQQWRNGKPAGLGLMGTEGTLHLVTGEVRCLRSLLHIHVKFHHVQKELQQVLILGITTLYRESHHGLAILQRDTGCQRGAWPLAGLNHIIWVHLFAQHKTLHT